MNLKETYPKAMLLMEINRDFRVMAAKIMFGVSSCRSNTHLVHSAIDKGKKGLRPDVTSYIRDNGDIRVWVGDSTGRWEFLETLIRENRPNENPQSADPGPVSS